MFYDASENGDKQKTLVVEENLKETSFWKTLIAKGWKAPGLNVNGVDVPVSLLTIDVNALASNTSQQTVPKSL